MQGWRTREPKTPPAIRGPGVISCAPASSNNRLEPAWGSLCTSSQSCPARLPDKAGPPPAAGCSFTGAALGGSRHVEVVFKRGLWSSTGQHCQELVGVAMLRLAGCQAHRDNMERRRFFRRPNSHSPAGSACHRGRHRSIQEAPASSVVATNWRRAACGGAVGQQLW